MSGRRRWAGALRRGGVALGLLGASASWAHSPVPGLGHFYNGALHPLLVPAHALALLAAGLWLAQGWPARRWGLAALVLGVPAGMLAALATAWTAGERPILLLAALIALAVALALARPGWRAGGIAGLALLGLLLGLDSMPEGLQGGPLLLSLGGTWAAALILPAVCIAWRTTLNWPWLSIAGRAVAAWLAAAAVLVLTLSVVPARRAPAAQGAAKPPQALAFAPANGLASAGQAILKLPRWPGQLAG